MGSPERMRSNRLLLARQMRSRLLTYTGSSKNSFAGSERTKPKLDCKGCAIRRIESRLHPLVGTVHHGDLILRDCQHSTHRLLLRSTAPIAVIYFSTRSFIRANASPSRAS